MSQLTNYHYQYNAAQFPQQTNTMIPQVHSTQSYSPMNAAPHLSQPQINHSSVLPSQQFLSHMDHQTLSVPQIAYHSPQVSTQPMNELPQLDSGLAFLVFTQGDDPIACLNNAMAFLSIVAVSRSRHSRPSRAQTTIPNNAAFQTEDLDAYDSDCDDVYNVKAMPMANLSNYGSDDFKQTPVVDFPENEITSDSNIISQHAVIHVIDDEETLILKEVSRSKMLAKQNDSISKEKKINTTPISYVELNRLSEDFGKHFVPQQELSAEQAFWLQTSHPNTDQSDTSPVKIEAPMELPKASMVNTSLKKLKYHLGKFDTMVKKRITPDAITEGEWGFEHTKAVFLLNEIIPIFIDLKTISMFFMERYF
ncbi:hypothetical protein Tco_1125412 [Tanacetum coccineum]|uniref:Uncharacterized protein n=1 Tax=Tanacetum coccineum TaxID=301880 RepID=A0ABQ5J8X5_9ASTR